VKRVQVLPWGWALGGAAGILGLTSAGIVAPAGAAAGLLYLGVSTALLTAGLQRRGARRLGPANAVTATRSAVVGVVTALVVTGLMTTTPVAPAGRGIDASALTVALVVPALALDAVDGAVARRTGSVTPLGARFDMEVDAFLLLVLSVAAAPALGPWVLAIGLMRYAFVAAALLLPWLGATLPPRYWRKVVTACCGIALTSALTGIGPGWLAAVVVGLALALLVESFGRDVIWLVRARRAQAASRSTVAAAPPLRPANTQVR
jgi:phosphatidylglycerophosphate synthase